MVSECTLVQLSCYSGLLSNMTSIRLHTVVPPPALEIRACVICDIASLSLGSLLLSLTQVLLHSTTNRTIRVEMLANGSLARKRASHSFSDLTNIAVG